MTTVEAPKATSRPTSDAQALQDENKRLHLLLETLKAKLLKAELAVKDGKPVSELKDMKEAILYVTPLGDPKNASQNKDMKDFYENLAASLAVPKVKTPSKAAKYAAASAVETKTTEKPGTQEAKTESTGATKSVEATASASDALADEFGDEEGRTSTKAKAKDSDTSTASSDTKALSSDDGQTVVVTSNEEPEDDSHRSSKKPPQQVCVVDLKNAEWWTLIDKEDAQEDENMYVDVKPDGTSADLNPDEDNHDDDEFDDGPEEALGEQYEVVKDDELASALSDYVSLSMKMYPEAKQVAPEEMKKMLDKAFGELKPKGAVARLWGWGQFAYTAYGWGQWVFRMYKEPAIVKLVATGVWNAAQWAIVFVL